MVKVRFLFLCLFLISFKALAIESLDGFLVSAYDDRFRVVSPEKFKPSMEIIIENKTLVRLIGKITVNKNTANASFISVNPEKYQKALVKLKKGDGPSFHSIVSGLSRSRAYRRE